MEQKNQIAVALGRLAAGHPKNYSQAERVRRAARMRAINEKRRLTNAQQH